MKLDRYVSSVSRMFVNNRLLKVAVIALTVMQAFSYASLKEARENMTTVLIPIGLSEKVEVGGSFADEGYLSAMAVYAAQLLYSTTPVTVESQTKTLLSLFSPEAYGRLGESYLLSSANQAKNQITRNSKILSVKIRTEPERVIEVVLSLDKYVFSDKAEETKRIKAEINYEISRGKFIITDIRETEG